MYIVNSVTPKCERSSQVPDFRKISRQSYDNRRIFVPYTLTLRQTYDNRMNIFNIVNITKYINVNIKTSIFTSSRKIIGKYVMLCNYTT